MSTARLWVEDAEIDWTVPSAAAVARQRSRVRAQRRRAGRARGILTAAVLAGTVALGIGIGHRGPAATVAPAPSAAPAAERSGVSAVTLDAIAHCESRGDPTAVSSDGRYRGKYQFDQATWRSIGGSGDPALASEAEQDRRARALAAERGTQPWPVCGPAATGQ